jgi:hypothetical protein
MQRGAALRLAVVGSMSMDAGQEYGATAGEVTAVGADRM